MRNLNPDNITEAFLHYFEQSSKDSKAGANPDLKETDANPRVMEIMACLAKHLHAFASEIELTHDEWNVGVEFLRQVGKKTTPERDEFILLSDVLGLSSLVDMINNNKDTKKGNRVTKLALNPTSSSVLGPFYLPNPPNFHFGADLKRDNGGNLVLVQGKILDAKTGNPVSNATMDVWQTAPNGMYSSQDAQQEHFNFHGLLSTKDNGDYGFTTSAPVPYKIPTDGPVGDLLGALGRHAWRPSHLHIIIEAKGYRTLVTEIFRDGDPFLDEDAVFGVRQDLVLAYKTETAEKFPKEGFDLSGQVKDDFLQVQLDLVLLPSAYDDFSSS